MEGVDSQLGVAFLLPISTYERKQLLVCHTSWYGTLGILLLFVAMKQLPVMARLVEPNSCSSNSRAYARIMR